MEKNLEVKPVITPIIEVKLRSAPESAASSHMRMFYFGASSNADYFSFRMMFLSPHFMILFEKLIKTAGDCVEKLLKCYLFSFNPSLDPKKDFSHDLNKIRQECTKIDSYFNKKELTIFCEQYAQRMEGYNGHQIFGYSDRTVVDTWQADLQQILDLLDEVFLETIIRMKNYIGLFHYDIFSIYLNSQTAQSKYEYPIGKFEEVKTVLFSKNKSIDSFYITNKLLIDQFQYKHK